MVSIKASIRTPQKLHNVLWRGLIFGILLCFVVFSSPFKAQGALSLQDKRLAQTILKNFFQMRLATGDFRQIGPRGDITHGKFYLSRPGKIRFYYKDSPLEIVGDGTSIAVHNKNLNSWDLYRLSQTPLKFVLADRLDTKLDPISKVSQQGSDIILTLHDKQLKGGHLELFFDAQTYQLRQWVILDRQNLSTKLILSNLQKNVVFADDMFTIPYQDIAMQKRARH